MPGKFDDLKQPKPASALGKLTLGAPAPGIPGTHLPPRHAPPPPPQRIAPDAETPLPPVHARARAATKTAMPAPPAPLSAPQPPTLPSLPPSMPGSQGGVQGPRSVSPPPWASPPELEAIKREAARHGDRVVEPPVSTPQPSGLAVDVQVGNQRVRVQAGGGVLRKVWPWLAPVVLSITGTVVGYAKGYFEGLAAAGRRVAAVEEGLRLNDEGDARRATRATSDVNRAFVMLDDHDARIPRLEKRADKIEQSLPKIEGLKPTPK